MLYFLVPNRFPTHDKLETFRHLPMGWHYGQGGPIDVGIIERAKEVITLLAVQGFTHTDAFANEGGEVLVTAYHHDHYIGIAVEPDGTYALNYERGGIDVEYVETLTLSAVASMLSQIALSIWNMSGSSTQANSTTTQAASTTWPSNDLPTVLACRSSSWSAPRQLATA